MTETSWEWPDTLGLKVYDVNGFALGRVAATHASGIDVALSERAAKRLHAFGRVVGVPFADVVDADEHEVTLREEGRFVVHPRDRHAFDV